MEELQDQRDRLFEAKKKLVKLVKKLEVAFEEEKGGSIRFDESEYSFDDGWIPSEIVHDENLYLTDDLELEDIDAQVQEVLKSMKDIQNLKKER